MKKRIYIKENWGMFPREDGSKKKEYRCEMFWKRYRLWPFWNKMDGTFDEPKRLSQLLGYEKNYDVFVWDGIFSQFVPLEEIL